MKRKAKKVYLVYDAPAGTLGAVMDSAKKVFGAGCDLCKITHGLAGKRKEWNRFEKEKCVKIAYMHRDDMENLEKRMGSKITLPCMLAEMEDGSLETLLSYITIHNLEEKTVEGLIEAMYAWAEMGDIEFSCEE